MANRDGYEKNVRRGNVPTPFGLKFSNLVEIKQIRNFMRNPWKNKK